MEREAKRKLHGWGKEPKHPFGKALRQIAESRGYISQTDLARALESNGNQMVNKWINGNNRPDAEHFSALIRLLKPQGDEMEELVVPYVSHLRDKSFKLSRSHISKPGQKGPVFDFLANYALVNKRTLGEVYRDIKTIWSDLGSAGQERVCEILQNAPLGLNLTEEETTTLGLAVARQIIDSGRAGKKSSVNARGARLLKIQAQLKCKTYNGNEAGQFLGLTRERVRQLRSKYNMPILMTDEHIEILKKRNKSVGPKVLKSSFPTV